MKTIGHLVITFLLISLVSLVSAKENKPEVELTHWWNTPGEISALGTIEQAIKRRGGKFTDIKIKNWDTLRSSTIKRFKMGYPPAVTQWLSGDSLIELSHLDAIVHPPEYWRGEQNSAILFEEVFKANAYEGKLINIPLGIHIQNNALYNTEIYKRLNLPIPESWDEFLDQAVKIKKAGYIPIALSKETWQLHMVFNTILLEKLKRKHHQDFYDHKKPVKRWEKQLTETFDVLLKLKALAGPDQTKRSWAQSAAMIGEGKAAMHVLGDFAKGELTAMGLIAGKDFLCSLAPGANGSMIYAIDSFVMLNVEEDYLKAGQNLLFDVALDPTVQAAYNSKKGGIPVRRGIDQSQLDVCAKQNYTSWLKPENSHLRLAGIGNPLRSSFIHSALEKAWNKSMTSKQLSDWLINTIDQSM